MEGALSRIAVLFNVASLDTAVLGQSLQGECEARGTANLLAGEAAATVHRAAADVEIALVKLVVQLREPEPSSACRAAAKLKIPALDEQMHTACSKFARLFERCWGKVRLCGAHVVHTPRRTSSTASVFRERFSAQLADVAHAAANAGAAGEADNTHSAESCRERRLRQLGRASVETQCLCACAFFAKQGTFA